MGTACAAAFAQVVTEEEDSCVASVLFRVRFWVWNIAFCMRLLRDQGWSSSVSTAAPQFSLKSLSRVCGLSAGAETTSA